jgi:hypothetical protein
VVDAEAMLGKTVVLHIGEWSLSLSLGLRVGFAGWEAEGLRGGR